MTETETDDFPPGSPDALSVDGHTHIWAVGGGKGGIGKSFVTSNVAIAIAQSRPAARIVVVDADLGGANVHTCLGIDAPDRTLADFMEGRYGSLNEILLQTSVPNLQIISGASDILSLANPHWSQKQKLIRHLRRLEVDFLLLDLGAGTSYNVLDFFNVAERKLVVVTPEPTSIQNAYGFIKSALYRRLGRTFSTNQMVTDLLAGGRVYGGERPPETIRQIVAFLRQEVPAVGNQVAREVQDFRCELILNMAEPPADAQVYRVMRSVTKGILDLDLPLLGSIPRDERVPRSVDQTSPLLLSYPNSAPAEQVRSVAKTLLERA